MFDLEPTRPPEDAPRLPAREPAEHDALWYDCETEGRDQGRGRAALVGAAALTAAALGIAAWYLA